ncbi:MAG: TolC family protein [Candidatus Omnitrophota bacterium]|jgi:outer membrane protein TolC
MRVKSRIKWIVLGIFAGIVLYGLSHAGVRPAFAETDVLQVSLDDAVSMAIKTSEDIRIQENEVARSDSNVRVAKSELLPYASGSAVWSRNYEYPNIPATAAIKEYDFNIGASVDQKLFTFGRIASSISAAKKQFEASCWDKETTNQDVIYIAKTSYYNACLAKRTLGIVQESYRHVQENKAILEDRSSSGRASKYDNIKMAADMASRIPMLSNARAALNYALETLKRVIGVDSQTQINIADGFDAEYILLDRQALTDELLSRQPALKALKTGVGAAQDMIWQKRAEYFPELSAFSTWSNKGSSNKSDIRSENLHDYGIIGLKVAMPIFEGGRRLEAVQQAKLDKSIAELNLKKLTKDLLLELDSAVVVYNEYVNTLHSYYESVRLASESFKLSQDMFHSGQISITDLNTAELLLTQEMLNRETALFNINETLAKIKKLTVQEPEKDE